VASSHYMETKQNGSGGGGGGGGVPNPAAASATRIPGSGSSNHVRSSLSRHHSTSTNGGGGVSPPGTPNKHVNFGGSQTSEEKKREKFLTAKYGAHQMALIRKRLRVEMWMYERLQELYGADDIEIDLDEVLDMDDESDRRTYIIELLRIDGNNACIKAERVSVFVSDLLEKVKTL